MKIILACRTLDNMAGGVERQITSLANAMVQRGHNVCLLTWDKENSISFYDIDDRIDWIRLSLGDPQKKANLTLRIKRLIRLRKAISNINPNIIIAFQHGTFLAIKLYTLGYGVPIIASTRNAPSMLKFTSAGKNKNIIHQTLRMSNKITVQFDSYKYAFPSYLHDRISTIPNAISPASEFANPDMAIQSQWNLLSVGRFSFQKNFGVLIHAFAILSPRFPDWTLTIAGEGEQQAMLYNLINKLNMQDAIKLPGTVTDINKLYSQSHIFCMPSLWEGFPNALSEALAHGLPSIGFADCDGVNELIIDGENGYLAKNKPEEKDNILSLASYLEMLMLNPSLRRNIGKNAIQSMTKYHPINAFDLWEKHLKDAV